mmetsp:Transcript_46458/g.87043  ORF Transcript_46458/g.87043 Transcript_46458/m.87043 type:complete len:326 (+) Transcript_46458:949-1926(+)
MLPRAVARGFVPSTGRLPRNPAPFGIGEIAWASKSSAGFVSLAFSASLSARRAPHFLQKIASAMKMLPHSRQCVAASPNEVGMSMVEGRRLPLPASAVTEGRRLLLLAGLSLLAIASRTDCGNLEMSAPVTDGRRAPMPKDMRLTGIIEVKPTFDVRRPDAVCTLVFDVRRGAVLVSDSFFVNDTEVLAESFFSMSSSDDLESLDFLLFTPSESSFSSPSPSSSSPSAMVPSSFSSSSSSPEPLSSVSESLPEESESSDAASNPGCGPPLPPIPKSPPRPPAKIDCRLLLSAGLLADRPPPIILPGFTDCLRCAINEKPPPVCWV